MRLVAHDADAAKLEAFGKIEDGPAVHAAP